MKLALTLYGQDVSNVFDFALELLIVELQNNTEASRTKVAIENLNGPQRVAILQQYAVDVLICGAISQSLTYMVQGAGIKLIPLVSGTVEQIIDAYKTGLLNTSNYLLPGCMNGLRRRMGKRRGYRGGRP